MNVRYTTPLAMNHVHKAWDCGYSATLCFDFDTHKRMGQVVGLQWEDGILMIRWDETEKDLGTVQNLHFTVRSVMEPMSVKGYVYAGDLAGNGKIQHGQKFKIKSSGAIFVGEKNDFNCDRVWVAGSSSVWPKQELEPYFE